MEQEPALQSAFEVARQSNLTRDEMETLDRQAMFIHDSRNAVLLGVKQGQEQGREQGLEEGREQGLEEGREQGLEKGEKKAKIAIARSLLNVLPIATISQTTGLSLEEIENL